MSRVARLWDARNNALRLPDLHQGSTATLVLSFGPSALGWELLGASSARPGPALDLTGATVVLEARRLPEGRRIVGSPCQDEDDDWAIQFSKEGTVTDGPGGVVAFELAATDLDAAGRFLAWPTAAIPGGAVVGPRLLRFTLIARAW